MARLDNIAPLSNDSVLLTIEGLNSGGTPTYFTEFSGIKLKRNSAKYSDGLSNYIRTTAGGMKEYENVTITKPYDPEKDDNVVQWLKQNESGEEFDFRLRPIKRVSNSSGTNEFRGNKAWDFTGCKIEGYTIADGVDTSDGSKVLTLQIEFSFDSVEFK
jgi:hypothetical protein